MEIDKCPPCSSGALRKRLWRNRQKCGIQIVAVEVDQEVVERLLMKRALKPDDAGDPKQIARAMVAVVSA